MVTRKTQKFIARQGDVLIVPIDKLPEGLNPTKRCTLALGEVTGHHHTIREGATGYTTQANPDQGNTVSLAEYFEVEEQLAKLEHQEHDTIEFPAGAYQVVRQYEYQPEAVRQVAD